MSTDYYTVLEDIFRVSPVNIDEYPPPYSETSTFAEKFESTKTAFIRAKRLNKQLLYLMNAYYLGKLLEKDAPYTERDLYARKLSQHYRIAVVRLYYLYENLGPKQLMRSTKMSLANVRGLTSDEHTRLVDETLRIFNGVENSEEG